MSAILSSPAPLQDTRDSDLDIVRQAGHIGAEVRGVRLSGELQPEVFRAIKAALLKHKVLFFRGQQHLDDTQQQAFGRLWGELVPHPTVPSRTARSCSNSTRATAAAPTRGTPT
jgi:alpha-ketoglutarate-dependent taurine dioxygenase